MLRLLQGSLNLNEIAGELYVSHNTVKTHTLALYRKLGASSRAEAVRIGRSRPAGVTAGQLTGGTRRGRVQPPTGPGQRPDRDGQPEGDQPVEQGAEHCLVGRHTRQHEDRGEPGLDEPEPARRERDQCEAQGDDIGEQHHRRSRACAHGVQRRDQGGVVEHPVGRGERQRAEPVSGEGGGDRVALGGHGVGHRRDRDASAYEVQHVAGSATDRMDEAVPLQQREAQADQQEGHHQGDHQTQLQLTGRRRTDDHGRHGQERQREQHPGGQQAHAAHRGCHGTGDCPPRTSMLACTTLPAALPPGRTLAAAFPASCELAFTNQVGLGQRDPEQEPQGRHAPGLEQHQEDEPHRSHPLQVGPLVEHRDQAGRHDVEADAGHRQADGPPTPTAGGAVHASSDMAAPWSSDP